MLVVAHYKGNVGVGAVLEKREELTRERFCIDTDFLLVVNFDVFSVFDEDLI
jgi:hypothetical protein